MTEETQPPGSDLAAVEAANEERKKTIEAANAAAQRLEAAEQANKEMILKMQAMQTEMQLAGKAEAGQEQPKEETAKEYAQRVMRGEL